MKSLHQQIEEKARQCRLELSKLKPNSRAVAQRLIGEGKLIKAECGKVWQWWEVSK